MLNRERVWDVGILILIFSGIVVVFSRTQAEVDLWGHLNWGKAILEAGQVVRIDPYSYLTEGHSWTNHEWLGDVIFALLWSRFGALGLLLLKLAAWLVSLGLVFGWLVRNGLPLLRAGLLLFLGGMLLNSFAISIRPQIFTILAYTIMLLVVLQAEAGRWRWLWALPPLFILWANLHGAWLAGLGLLGVWGLVHLLTNRNRQTWLQIIPPLLVSALATLLTPFGFELWQFLIGHISERRLEIVEWRPIELHSRIGWAFLAWIVLVVVGLVFSRRQRAPASLALLGVSAYLPWVSYRHMMFFALAALMVAGPHIGDAWRRWMPVKPSVNRTMWGLILPFLAAGLLLALRLPNFKTIPIPDPSKYPSGAVELLRQSNVRANLANHFNWGNYLSWHLAPQIKVSVDTRREMAYPPEAYQANLRFLTGSGDWDSLLENYPTELVLIDNGSTTDNLMKQRPDWQEIYREAAGVLYARGGSELAEKLEAAVKGLVTPPPPTEFP